MFVWWESNKPTTWELHHLHWNQQYGQFQYSKFDVINTLQYYLFLNSHTFKKICSKFTWNFSPSPSPISCIRQFSFFSFFNIFVENYYRPWSVLYTCLWRLSRAKVKLESSLCSGQLRDREKGRIRECGVQDYVTDLVSRLDCNCERI